MEFEKCFIFFFGFILFSHLQTPTFAIRKSYIVYLGSHSHGREATNADYDRATESHHELLGSFLGSSMEAKEAIIYSYTRHINGFAAMLDEKVAAEIEKHPSVLKVFPNQVRKLHTTRSWELMSQTSNGETLPDSLLKKGRHGEDTIIGNIDTGVWPESASFSDEGMGPIPSRWKGSCVDHDPTGFRCNRKLIGARYFNKGFLEILKTGDPTLVNHTIYHTVRDTEGHGSHTLSTAGGGFVRGANISGRLAYGTASGGSPKARVATYKACWRDGDYLGGCSDDDMFAAFDFAIHDGVDVLSISIGGYPTDYIGDTLAVGTFHAFKEGISVVCSAGNEGPYPNSVANMAPWMLSVAASTMDRSFQALVELQNGQIFKGVSLSEAVPEDKLYPLISSVKAKKAKAAADDAKLCLDGTLDPKKVKGKILVCLRGNSARMEKGNVALKAGAIGMILCNDKADNEIIAELHMLPTSNIKYEDTLELFAYLNSTTNPMGYLHPPTDKLNMKPSPVVAAFSSRGPSAFVPEILKPDVTAPGVDVLAAYSEAASPTEWDFDNRRVPFMVMSGTSMSCPHVSGVVGLLRTLYPDWTPSAIKSAIMTSARTRDNTGHPILDGNTLAKATPFDYGSGHIRPNKAIDPGLVYDLTINDYLNFLCVLYNSTNMRVFYDAPYKCPYSFNILNFNYPSIAISTLYSHVNVTRTLKNVGSPATYVAQVRPPPGVAITVEPKILKFEKVGEEKSFTLSVEVIRHGYTTVFGGLIWSDGKHYVRSPISVGGVNA